MSVEAQPEAIPLSPAPEAPTQEAVSEPPTQDAEVKPIEEGAPVDEKYVVPDAPEPFTPEKYAEEPSFKEWSEETTSRAKREGLIEGLSNINTLTVQAEQRKDDVMQAAGEINAYFKQVLDAGLMADPTHLGRLLTRHAPALNDIPRILAEGTLSAAVGQGQAVSTANTLAMLADGDKDLLDIATRLVRATNNRDAQGNPVFEPSPEFHYDRGQTAITDFMKKYKKAVESAAEEKGYQRGLKDQKGAAAEAQKAQERDGKGPSTVTGAASGGKTYSTMTYEERQALSPADRDRLAAQES